MALLAHGTHKALLMAGRHPDRGPGHAQVLRPCAGQARDLQGGGGVAHQGSRGCQVRAHARTLAVCLRACVCACVHACMYAHIHVCTSVRASSVCVGAHSCVHACVCMCVCLTGEHCPGRPVRSVWPEGRPVSLPRAQWDQPKVRTACCAQVVQRLNAVSPPEVECLSTKG